MKKKLLTILLCGMLILGIATGCKEQEEQVPENQEEKSKGKCEVAECINLIEPEMTVEEVNEIIGFEGERKDETDTYIWQLTEKTKIQVEYKEDLGTITATYEKDKISNDNLKASVFYTMQNSLKSGTTFTYEEMVDEFEGIEGYLESKSPTSKMYMWVKDGQTFRATFSDSLDGKCSIVSLR